MFTEKEFLDLLNMHKGIVHKVCMLYAHTEEDRQDLFQEIVVQLWKSISGYKGNAKISTWIYRVALNTAIAGLRKSYRSFESEELKEQYYNTADENTEEKFIHLQQAVKQLPEIERALVMLYLDGNNYDEISDIMGITANNARVKMSRIREKLKQLLNQ